MYRHLFDKDYLAKEEIRTKTINIIKRLVQKSHPIFTYFNLLYNDLLNIIFPYLKTVVNKKLTTFERSTNNSDFLLIFYPIVYIN